MAVNVKKVSVAIGREELAWARKRARLSKTSVSAVLTAATREAREAEARRERRLEAWRGFLAWATDGEGLSDEELDRGRRELDEA